MLVRRKWGFRRSATADVRPRSWWRRGGLTADGIAAVLTWAVATPLALLLVRGLDLDPFSVAGVVMPVAVGAVAGAAVLTLLLRRYSDMLIGVATGVYAAWIGLTLSTALHGTPFGYGQMLGDSGRLVAQATKSMSTWSSADAFVKGLPTEYPPLYPWTVGHIAALVNRPAWTLFGEMQIAVMTLSIVLGYLLWRRLASAPVAFAIVGIAPAIFSEPSKDYEFIVLVVFVPWILATFTGLSRDRGGLHWLPAGVIGGLLVLTYQGFLLYAAAGLLVLLVLTWRASAARGQYLLHLLGVAVTAFVVSSWYVVPFVYTLLTDGGQRVSDLWESSAIVDRPMVLPFLDPTPLGVIELVGLLGLVWYRRSTWWAQPLLLLLLGTYAYRVLFLLRTVYDNHNGYLQYTERPIAMLLVSAGVLTAAEAAPGLGRRLAASPAAPGRAVAVTGMAVLVAWAGLQGWQGWVPAPRGLRDAVSGVGEPNQATLAHSERLPGGGRTRFAPPGKGQRFFPSDEVTKVIRTELGKNARPVVLSYDQRLFTFEPFYAYVAPNRLSANTLQRWDDRAAAIDKLTRISDAAEFATASDNTAFGGIDVFVLKAGGGRWAWRAASFSPTVFDPSQWYVEQLPDRTVVAVRKA
jgi:hypothetical protein